MPSTLNEGFSSQIVQTTTKGDEAMGMRCTQVIGLSQAAQELVQGEEVVIYVEEGERVYPDGRREAFSCPVEGSTVRTEETGKCFHGMFGESYPLNRYIFPDGRVLEEAIQAEPWSSGPCIFLALKEQGEWVKASLWSDEEIDNA